MSPNNRMVGLYPLKQPPKPTPEQLERLERLYPRPQVDIEREMGQLAIIKENLSGN